MITGQTDTTLRATTTHVVPTRLMTLISLTVVQTLPISSGGTLWIERCIVTMISRRLNITTCFMCLEGLKEKPKITSILDRELTPMTYSLMWLTCLNS